MKPTRTIAALLEPQYGGTTSILVGQQLKLFLTANPDADALIVSGGGGDPLVGAIEAIEGLGLTGKINVHLQTSYQILRNN